MKTLSSWMILLLFSMFSMSCSPTLGETPNESETPNEEEVVKDEYYVQYEVGGINHVIHSISVTTPWGTDGLAPGTTAKTWSETYGPVSKGFCANIRVSGTGTLFRVVIRVSKNGGPFALKASKTESGSVSVSYTIE